MNPYHEPWTEFASCRSISGDMWFPELGEAWRDVRNVCLACPVLWQCRDWVMRTELGLSKSLRFGITGGLTPNERVDYEPRWLAEQEEVA